MIEELIPKVRAKIKTLPRTLTYICSSQCPEISIQFQNIWGMQFYGTIVHWRQTSQKDKNMHCSTCQLISKNSKFPKMEGGVLLRI